MVGSEFMKKSNSEVDIAYQVLKPDQKKDFMKRFENFQRYQGHTKLKMKR